jgi:hypothetical protein
VADAKLARLWGKSGPWQQYPKRMLQMRARVAFRDLFADALGGHYIAEELIGIEESAKDITPPQPPKPPVVGETKPLPPAAAAARQEEDIKQINDDLVQMGAIPLTPNTDTDMSYTFPKDSAQVPLDGEVLEPNGKKPLPPAAAKPKAKAKPAPEQVLSPGEAAAERDHLMDAIELCKTKFVLAQWINANVQNIHALPQAYRDDVEQAMKLKEATLDKRK